MKLIRRSAAATAASTGSGNAYDGHEASDGQGTVGSPADPDEQTTAARVENVLARAAVFFRVAGLAQIALAAAFDAGRYPRPLPTFGLITAVAAESVLWSAVTLRARRNQPAATVLDTVFMVAAIPVGAWLTAPRDFHTWVHFMYPFSLIACIALGVTFTRLRTVAGLTILIVASYTTSAVLQHHDPLWNSAPNALSYIANTTVAWAVARHLRSSGRAADASRAAAVHHADELARERERARHARMLHDRVLQTLETLAHGDWFPDADLRAHLATEAAWLRALVEGQPLDQPADLLTALQVVVQGKTRIGLRVDFNSTQLREAAQLRSTLPAAIVTALAEATGEALTNVAKHSGVDTATVRATLTEHEIVISVLDHGCGFDARTVRPRIGLSHSITDRLAEVDGVARIDSAPGSGTYVELAVRLERA
ncbi:sensor histidine kinase [Catenulispora rubra]|uniref:sensor histidine kinase n=1 Tax=Catenulispora rubra TaxID=280293 RepID=UPI0018923970|nr:ATP-binding protein [Catenulispora rubra]